MLKIESLSILISSAMLIFVVFLVRTRRLHLRYSLLWLLTFIMMIVLSCFPLILVRISFAVGIHYPPSFLFLVAFLFLLIIVLHYSLVMSALSEVSKGLIQKMGIMDYRLGELEKKFAELNR